MKKPMQSLLRHPFWVGAIVCLIVIGIVAVRRHTSEWNEVYVGAAQALIQGKDIYNHKDIRGYTYPPLAAWLMVPFTQVPPRVARAIWYVICAGSLVYSVRAAWRLAGGAPLEAQGMSPGQHRRQLLACLAGHACALQFALNALQHLQPDLLIMAMILAGCAAIVGGRFFSGATWIGLAAAFKATPLLFAPYLVYRRKWLAAVWLVAVMILVNLLPNTIPAPGGRVWLVEWYRIFLAPMAKSDYRPGDWQNLLDNNQSFAGAVDRWMASTWQNGPGEFKVFDRPNPPSTLAIRAAFAALCLASLAPIAWAEWRRRRLPAGAPGKNGIDPAVIECGMVLLLMLLFSPNSSRAHFCFMYLPAFCLARIAVGASGPPRTAELGRRGGRAFIGAMLVLAIVCSTLSIHVRLPGTQGVEQLLLWVGVVMFSTVFLLLGSAAALAGLGANSKSEARSTN